MPHRFQVVERIAFSLVVLFAAACSAFIAYERCPDVKQVMQASEQVLSYSGQYAYACTTSAADICGQLPVN